MKKLYAKAEMELLELKSLVYTGDESKEPEVEEGTMD